MNAMGEGRIFRGFHR